MKLGPEDPVFFDKIIAVILMGWRLFKGVFLLADYFYIYTS